MIINEIALIVNETIIKLYANGIKFYQIIIGLLILNVCIYFIRKICKNISLGRQY